MTRSSDLVMVEREVLESIRAAVLEAPAGVLTDTLWIPERFSFNETVVDCIDAALQSVEGGFQGSIATKQATDLTSASATETAIQLTREEALQESAYLAGAKAGWNFGVVNDADGYDRLVQGRAGYLETLTKTPSADHDAGNLRSLAEPNHHQPHALSQGWQPIETAPKDGTRIIAVGWDWGIVGNERHVTTVSWRQDREEWCETDGSEDDSACAYLTHWMPLPAPPSPENTPRDSSESTTGGAS